MEKIVAYFAEIPTSHRTLMLIGGLTLFLLAESAIPLFRVRYQKWRHALINIFFTLTTIAVNFAMAFVLVWAATLVVDRGIGIFQWVEAPLWLMAFGGILLMDLIGAYLPHFMEHKIRWMWQFHLVHHTDQHVDTTTANRHHPGESVIRFVFTLASILIVGAPMWMVFLYQSCSLVATQFSHSNIKLPQLLDDALAYLLVTPNIHRVHHHYRQPYSDSNFGNIFTVWDRAFGTLMIADNSKIVFGVDTHMDHDEVANVWSLLKMPFTKYRSEIKYDTKEEI